VIKHLQLENKDENVGIAWIFYVYKERDQQSLSNIVGSLLKQLVRQSRRAPSEKLKEAYEKHDREHTRPTFEQYSELLRFEIDRYGDVFIIVDALDESPDDGSARQDLFDELKSLPEKAHLMVTSRSHVFDADEFRNAASIRLFAQDADVRKYLGARLQRSRKFAEVLGSKPGLKEKLVETLIRNTKGM
jgi:hypothetical protein